MVHIDNKKNDILILGKSAVDGLDDATLTEEKKYSLGNERGFCLSCIIMDGIVAY